MKPSEYALHDPIAAIATALAPSALGIVRTSGAQAIEYASRVFSRPDALLKAAGNTLVHGWILDTDGTKIDEVIACVYRAPKSFTGEDAVEFIGHGGIATVFAVYKRLLKAGFRAAEGGEFTFRAFAQGKTDLIRAEAIREIVDARTDSGRLKAAQRLAGNLSEHIKQISTKIIHVLAAIGVEIEYPEDEETSKGAYDARLVIEAMQELQELAQTWASEKMYQDGARLVLAGRTNAGKSSMFNTLLKEERAIVSNIHGTTRDWLEARADFLGIPVSLFDTAGLRETEDCIEAEGVLRSKGLAEDADCILYLVDACEGLNTEDLTFIAHTKAQGKTPLILVWNKADKQGAQKPPTRHEGVTLIAITSTKQNHGIKELVEAVVDLLTREHVSVREAGLGTERQKQAVEEALDYLEHAQTAVKTGFPMDAIAQDLEDALTALAQITGEVSSDDILDAVFTGFCVGK